MKALAAVEVLAGMRRALGETGRPAPMECSTEAFPVLVGTVISLRTRDAVTRQVSRRLLDEAPDPATMLSIGEDRLQELLRPAGFYRQKARQLREISRLILKEHGGRVPGGMEDLLRLPGVGRKTANFVMGMVFGVPSICVDVHVHRISNRLGLVRTGTPEATETALMELFPEEMWTGLNHTMVRFGQRVCRPVRPLCGECPFASECPSSSWGAEG